MASGSRSCSERIADFAHGLTFESIPPQVIEKAKIHLLDTIGVGMAGRTAEWCASASLVFEEVGGAGEATVFGSPTRIPAVNAAMANGIAIASLEYDDTDYFGGGGHMSRALVPCALAAAEANRRSGRELLTALIGGYEVASRVGAGLMLDRYGPRAARANWTQAERDAHHRMQQQGGSQVRGHLTGLFGSAVIAARLARADAAQITSAQGLVGGLGLFLGQAHREGADGLVLHGGWAAHAGMIAAAWARRGLKGPRQIYEGDRGLLQVIGGELHDASQIAAGLGSTWNTQNNLIKFLPGGHGAHHFVEALKGLIAEHRLAFDDVKQIVCRAPAQRIEFHFEPLEQKRRPTPYNALFSLPYLLARLLKDGKLDARSFSAAKVSEPAVLDMASRVSYIHDELAWMGEKRGLTTVTLRDGRTFERSAPDLLGFPKRPGSSEDVLSKFTENARLLLQREESVKALRERLENIEQVRNVAELMRLTVQQSL